MGIAWAGQPPKISLLQVIEALEGDARRRQCVLRAAPCGRDGYCDVHAVFAAAQDALLERFSSARLSDLAGPPSLAGQSSAA